MGIRVAQVPETLGSEGHDVLLDFKAMSGTTLVEAMTPPWLARARINRSRTRLGRTLP